MSREVQGDAPADAVVVTARWDAGTLATRPGRTLLTDAERDTLDPEQLDRILLDRLRMDRARQDRLRMEQLQERLAAERAEQAARPGGRLLQLAGRLGLDRLVEQAGLGARLARGADAGLGRWRLPGALLAVLLTGSLGWLAAGAWQPPAPPPPPEAVTATVLDARADGDRPTPIRGRMRVTVENPGDHAVAVVGFEPSRDSGFVLGLDPRRLEVPAGGSADLVVQFAVRCGDAAPLDLPGLRVRRPDGGLRPIPLEGATDALAALCSGWPHQEPLVVDSVRRDGDRLALRLRVPGGRSTRIDSAAAGAFVLTVSDLPNTVDGGGTTVWLVPPASCPVRWQQTGIPRTLTLQGDLGGPATLTLTIGSLMSDWILDTACPRGGAG